MDLSSYLEQRGAASDLAARLCDVLHAAKWLQYNQAGNRWQHQLKGKGRFFLIYGVLPPEEMEE